MYYSNIIEDDIANGEGIRVSLFVSGCQFHCPSCFNQEAQNYTYGKEYTKETEEKILKLVERPWCAGLSILGGDPLWQDTRGLWELFDLCDEVAIRGKNTWIWSGFIWEELFETPDSLDKDESYLSISRRSLILQTDVFVDGRFEKDKKDLSLKWRGSSNQRVIDIKATKENDLKPVLYCD